MVFNASSVNFSTSCMGKVIPSQLSYYEDQINQRLFDKREKILTNHYFFQGRDHIYLKETKVFKKLLSSQGEVTFLGVILEAKEHTWGQVETLQRLWASVVM